MICIVYSVEDESTIDRVCGNSFSMKYFRLCILLQEVYFTLAAVCLWCFFFFVFFFQIREYWLPLLRRTLPEEHRRPVILVGNKSDLMEVSSMEVNSLCNIQFHVPIL